MHLLNDAAINAIGIRGAPYLESVRRALIAHARDDLKVIGKRTLISDLGAYATGTHGIWPERGLAFFHNLVGLERNTAGVAGSVYKSTQTLFNLKDAEPTLIVQGAAISSLVPVIVTCIGSELLAPVQSTKVGFVGAGLQARLHLEAIAGIHSIKEITVFSRSTASTRALICLAEELGFRATVTDTAREAVESADIVVSSISESLGIKPFVDLSWLKPGAFLAAVDMLRPWYQGSAVDLVIVADDAAQARDMALHGRISNLGPINAELGVLLNTGNKPSVDAIKVLLHPGCCSTLFGMAVAVFDHAQSSFLAVETGNVLP